MTTGACFGRVFLRMVKGLRTTRLMPGASRLSAIVSGQDGRSGGTPKRAPILTLNGGVSERQTRFGQRRGVKGGGKVDHLDGLTGCVNANLILSIFASLKLTLPVDGNPANVKLTHPSCP